MQNKSGNSRNAFDRSQDPWQTDNPAQLDTKDTPRGNDETLNEYADFQRHLPIMKRIPKRYAGLMDMVAAKAYKVTHKLSLTWLKIAPAYLITEPLLGHTPPGSHPGIRSWRSRHSRLLQTPGNDSVRSTQACLTWKALPRRTQVRGYRTLRSIMLYSTSASHVPLNL